MTMLSLVCEAGILLLVLLTGLWAISVRLKDASLVDRVWGLTFVVAAWWYRLRGGAAWDLRAEVGLLLVTLWGVRLSWYIHQRNRGHGEDHRYQKFRRDAPGTFWWRSLFTVFWLQGALALVIGLPHYFIQTDGGATPWGLTDTAGVLLWCIGFVFEAGGDWQLKRFKKDPANKGKLLTTGLWGLTRHPNYFGDTCVWWGYFLLAAAVPGGIWTAGSAALMTFLIVKVSGVSLLEKSLTKVKPGYEEYVRKTPAFVPRLWPRR